MAGLGVSLGVYLMLGLGGLVSGTGPAIAALFGQFLALLVAGFVAGRLTGRHAILNGGLSGMTVFAVAVVISVSGGASPGIGALLLLGVVAAVVGTSGGVLAAHLAGDR